MHFTGAGDALTTLVGGAVTSSNHHHQNHNNHNNNHRNFLGNLFSRGGGRRRPPSVGLIGLERLPHTAADPFASTAVVIAPINQIHTLTLCYQFHGCSQDILPPFIITSPTPTPFVPDLLFFADAAPRFSFCHYSSPSLLHKRRNEDNHCLRSTNICPIIIVTPLILVNESSKTTSRATPSSSIIVNTFDIIIVIVSIVWSEWW